MGIKKFFQDLIKTEDKTPKQDGVEAPAEGQEVASKEETAPAKKEPSVPIKDKNTPKPGNYCKKSCTAHIYKGTCEECLAAQDIFLNALIDLELLEETIDFSISELKEINDAKEETLYCTFCGAPVVKGRKTCEYCDTEYVEYYPPFDIPESRVERINLYNRQIEHVWQLLINEAVIQSKLDEFDIGFIKAIKRGVGKIGLKKENTMKQTASEIKEGAIHYGVPVSVYIGGVITGEYSTPRGLYWSDIATQVAVNTANNLIESRVIGYSGNNQPTVQQQPQYSNYNAYSNWYSQQDFGGYQPKLFSSERSNNVMKSYKHRKIKLGSVGLAGSKVCGDCKCFYNGKCSKGRATSGASDGCGLFELK